MDALEHGGDTERQSIPKLQIEAMLSVPPHKVTEPRRVRRVLVNDDPNTIHPRTIGGCYQIVLYYERLNNVGDQGWFLAGWIVESLARALSEQPLLAGRLRRREVGGDDCCGLEIVSNDSGIRLFEARYPMTLSEFLESSEREHLEAELVYWKEIDEQCPEFSPLFYVQATNFECRGYSVGISCSLLLAEVLIVENFLKKWAEIHNNILPQNGEIANPIFYHPRPKIPQSLPDDLISRTPSKNGVQSMVFKITAKDANFNSESWRELAMLCVEEAGRKLHRKMGSDYSLFVRESSEVIKVESCSSETNRYSTMQVLGLENQISRTTWDDFGVYEVAFYEGNKPVLVSCWIESVADVHVNVMAVPHPRENVSAVIVASPPVET